jgi:Uma2 family endonuclease
MAVATLLTAEDLLQVPEDLRCELVDGVLIESSPPGGRHAQIAGRTAILLGGFEGLADFRVLGEIGCLLRRNPDTVRAPDLAVIRSRRIPSVGLPNAYWEGAPDLVVEVLSPSNTASETRTKVREWVEGGASLVLVIDAARETVEVVRSLQDRLILSRADTVDASDLFPGLVFPITQIFD